MIVRKADVYRALEKHYGQDRFSYRGRYIGRGSAFVVGACKSGEWSNRRWRSGRTYRRGVARWRPGGASCAAAAGLLRARAGLRRRARLPIDSRALLGWIWLAISASSGLRLKERTDVFRSRFEQDQIQLRPNEKAALKSGLFI